jgi:hypothetical protein
VTDREREQHALLDRVDDEIRRARSGRHRRELRTVAWAVAALLPVALAAWFVDGAMLDEHGFWGGVVLSLVVVSGLGVGAEVTKWLRDHEDGVAHVRAARRAHRDHELTAWSEARRSETRDQRRQLDDLDDAHPVISRYLAKDVAKGAVWLALLAERLHRYPVDDRQVAATRLGNAIRRFEEYGYNRYLLDSQVLWHELNAVVPDPVRKQVEDGRTNVDFFISPLYGHFVVALAAAVDLVAGTAGQPWTVAGALVALLVLSAIWYRVAVVATDEWAGAVRAMVNLGRRPLATALGLELPGTIDAERAMWRHTSDLVGSEYTPGVALLDPYRTSTPGA